MKNNTMYILGGVALVGVAYYLYNKNKPTTQTNSSGFANASGQIKCPPGYAYNSATRQCVKISNYANASGQIKCPPGYAYNSATRQCVKISNYANVGGGGCSCGTCPPGFTCQSYKTARGTTLCGCIQELAR